MEDRKINGAMDTTDILHRIGLVNASLQSSAACYERLGFTLTPLSLRRVILRPGGEPELLGAGNRHAIFTNNYLELLGIVDAGRWAEVTKEQRGPYDLDVPLCRYEGLHVMHFGTSHIESDIHTYHPRGTTRHDLEYQISRPPVVEKRLLKLEIKAEFVRLFSRLGDQPYIFLIVHSVGIRTNKDRGWPHLRQWTSSRSRSHLRSTLR